MNAWEIVAAAVGSWCAFSVVAGVLVGHAIAGRPLRSRLAPVGAVVGAVEGAVEAAVDAVTAPVTMLAESRAADQAGLEAAV